jgi:hypothetical protein
MSGTDRQSEHSRLFQAGWPQAKPNLTALSFLVYKWGSQVMLPGVGENNVSEVPACSQHSLNGSDCQGGLYKRRSDTGSWT